MNQKNNELNISEGTITFWIDPKKVNLWSNEIIPLVQLNPIGGSIFILKDNDNKIKFFHVLMSKGRTNADVDISSLSKEDKHMFGFTWSIKERKIKIYIDGELKKESNINY